MNKTKYPPGWDESRVRKVLEYYESQSDEEAAAEIEAASGSTTVEVPTVLLPAVRQLIARRKASRARKTHNTTLQPPSRAPRKSKARKVARASRG